jgi:hypothetical protein
VTLILGTDSEHAWLGNGQGYPSNPADNTTGTWTPAAAQQTTTRSSTSTSSQQTSSSTPPPPPPTPTPVLCLPPACHPKP